MRRSSLIVCALLVTATFGCEQVKKQVANVKQQVELVRQRFLKKKPAPAAPLHPAPPPAPAAAPAPPPPPPASAAVQQVAVVHPHRDIPYVSEDTGTVFPGMSERDVYSLWGSPVAVRHLGEFTYLYFNNGCEYSCGHLDVVTLQNGQVVDALVRWPGHGYAGRSSSPEGTEPEPRAGGDTLQIAPPPAVNQAPDTTPAPPAPQAP
jgi:hypothetical protein